MHLVFVGCVLIKCTSFRRNNGEVVAVMYNKSAKKNCAVGLIMKRLTWCSYFIQTVSRTFVTETYKLQNINMCRPIMFDRDDVVYNDYAISKYNYNIIIFIL